MKRGLLLILSGPAGSGKGTVISELMRLSDNFHYSVSATTRAPRPGEREGVAYYFVTREQFEEKIAGGMMLEYAEYIDNYYGTPTEPVETALERGRDVILEIETQGALKVMEKVPDTVSIMILPPSGEELERRLTARGTETADVVKKRMMAARREVALLDRYDYVVINENGAAKEAARRILDIIEAERARTSRNGEIKEKYFDT